MPSLTPFSIPIPWWEELGLSFYDSVGFPGHPHRRRNIAAEALAKYRPVAFVNETTGESLTLPDLAAEVKVAKLQAARDLGSTREEYQATERRLGWERIAAAAAAPDADVVIADGPWAGFARAEAIAWCWNLFQYEPSGFTHPGSQVRIEALEKLRRGEIPAVFGYPDRARKLANLGTSPTDYRHSREALGAELFDPSRVTHS